MAVCGVLQAIRILLDRVKGSESERDALRKQFVDAVAAATAAVRKASTHATVEKQKAKRRASLSRRQAHKQNQSKASKRNQRRGKHSGSHTRTPAERIASLGTALARLQEFNLLDGEPEDEAGAKMEEATEVVNHIAVLQDRLAVSYYVPYVEKEIRELLRPTVLTVRAAQVAMVSRADNTLADVIVKRGKLERRNQTTGNPDDEGTRLLAKSVDLVDAAQDAQAKKVRVLLCG